jgi:hypothetical protein
MLAYYLALNICFSVLLFQKMGFPRFYLLRAD